jgi:hypothetical protein
MNIDQIKILLKQLTWKSYGDLITADSSITDFIMVTLQSQMARVSSGDVQFESGSQQQIQDRPGFYFFNKFRFSPAVIEQTSGTSALANFTWSHVLPNLKLTPLQEQPQTAMDYLELGEIWIDDIKSLEICGEAILKRYGFLIE